MKRSIVVVLAMGVLVAGAPGSAHPGDPRSRHVVGTDVALGAAVVMAPSGPVGLFEYYAQTAGAVAAYRGEFGSSVPEADGSGGPWVAALYYPFYGLNNVMTFTSRPADQVTISMSGGADVRFRMPRVGNVRLVVRPSTATPQARTVALTTPGNRHGHTWDMFGALAQGKRGYVSGTITRKGTRLRIVELGLPGGVITTWLGTGAWALIQTN